MLCKKLCDKIIGRARIILEVKLAMSSYHGCEEMDRLVEKYGFKNFARMGSSLKGCLIAKGEAEIYYRYNPTMEWDTGMGHGCYAVHCRGGGRHF